MSEHLYSPGTTFFVSPIVADFSCLTAHLEKNSLGYCQLDRQSLANVCTTPFQFFSWYLRLSVASVFMHLVHVALQWTTQRICLKTHIITMALLIISHLKLVIVANTMTLHPAYQNLLYRIKRLYGCAQPQYSIHQTYLAVVSKSKFFCCGTACIVDFSDIRKFVRTHVQSCTICFLFYCYWNLCRLCIRRLSLC